MSAEASCLPGRKHQPLPLGPVADPLSSISTEELAMALAHSLDVALVLFQLGDEHAAAEVAALSAHCLTRLVERLKIPYVPEAHSSFRGARPLRARVDVERLGAALALAAGLFEGRELSGGEIETVRSACASLTASEACYRGAEQAALTLLLAVNDLVNRVLRGARS